VKPVRALAKRLLIGTRLESPVRRAHHALTGSKNSLYDFQTIQIMSRVLSRESNAIDIGAFEGGMLRHIIRLAPRGKHVAFEPQPEKAEKLAKDHPTVTVYPYAVGSEQGTATFYCMQEHPALSGLSRRSRDLPEEGTRETQVPGELLDRVIPPDLPVAFVKNDVEGAELEVFWGGGRRSVGVGP